MRPILAALLGMALVVAVPAVVMGDTGYAAEIAMSMILFVLPPWLIFKLVLALGWRARLGPGRRRLLLDGALHVGFLALLPAAVTLSMESGIVPVFVAVGAATGLAAWAVERGVLALWRPRPEGVA